MMTEIQTREGGWKDVSSLEGTTLKQNIHVIVIPCSVSLAIRSLHKRIPHPSPETSKIQGLAYFFNPDLLLFVSEASNFSLQ